MTARCVTLAIFATSVLAACSSPSDEVTPDTAPQGFREIGEDETITFTGTEPFWGGTIDGERLVWNTPENAAEAGQEGETIAVKRFYGQGGLAFSGRFHGDAFDMTVTPGICSDGMSDRRYPFTVTVKIAERQLDGCGYTDGRPFDGAAAP